MKKLPLLITSLSIICFISAKNSLFDKMMKDRQIILIASQNPETPDPFTSNASDAEQPISEPLGSLTNLTEDETILAKELAAVVESLAHLPAPDSSETDSGIDPDSESEPA